MELVDLEGCGGTGVWMCRGMDVQGCGCEDACDVAIRITESMEEKNIMNVEGCVEE